MAITEIDAQVPPEFVSTRLDSFASDDPDLRLVEVDIDPKRYEEQHIPGAIGLGWERDLAGEYGRDLVTQHEFERLLGNCGIAEGSRVVLYGDQANWFASHAYWLFNYYGHEDVYLMRGGRHYWLSNDCPVSSEKPSYSSRQYYAVKADDTIDAYINDVDELTSIHG